MAAHRLGTVGAYFLSYNLYAFATGLVGVFLNLFFFSNYSFLAVLYFQIATYATLLGVYLVSSYLLPRWRPKHLYVLGLALSAFVLVDMLAASRIVSNAFLFGVLWGGAGGVFWAGNNPMMHDITRKANRTPFVATNGFLTGLVTLVAPVSAGVLIQFSEFSGVLRYIWDFAITAGFLLASALVIIGTRGETDRPMQDPGDTVRSRPGREFVPFRVYFVTSQFFAIPAGIILPIYVFQVTGSYVVTGVFASFTILVSIVANLGWRYGFRREGPFTLLAVLAIIAASALLVVQWDPPVDAFAFMGVYTLLSTPLGNMVTVEFMNLIDRTAQLDRTRGWADRELHLGMGRALVLGGMILVSTYYLRNPRDLILILPLLSLYSLSFLLVLSSRSPNGAPRPRPRDPAISHDPRTRHWIAFGIFVALIAIVVGLAVLSSVGAFATMTNGVGSAVPVEVFIALAALLGVTLLSIFMIHWGWPWEDRRPFGVSVDRVRWGEPGVGDPAVVAARQRYLHGEMTRKEYEQVLADLARRGRGPGAPPSGG